MIDLLHLLQTLIKNHFVYRNRLNLSLIATILGTKHIQSKENAVICTYMRAWKQKKKKTCKSKKNFVCKLPKVSFFVCKSLASMAAIWDSFLFYSSLWTFLYLIILSYRNGRPSCLWLPPFTQWKTLPCTRSNYK